VLCCHWLSVTLCCVVIGFRAYGGHAAERDPGDPPVGRVSQPQHGSREQGAGRPEPDQCLSIQQDVPGEAAVSSLGGREDVWQQEGCWFDPRASA